MHSLLQKILTSILIASIIFPTPVFARTNSNEDTKPKTIVVYPVKDEDADSRSREISRQVAGTLSQRTGYRIIDSNLTERVVGYSSSRTTRPKTAAPDAETALSRAKELFFQFNYAGAMREADRALGLLKGSLISDTGPLLIDTLMSRAIIAKSRGELGVARESISEALKINPRLNLSLDEYPPSLVELARQERERLAAFPTGSVEVSTTPPSMDVLINGIRQGVSPISIAGLPVGSYTVSIRAERYDPVEKQMEVKAGRRVSVHEKLKWADNNDEAAPVEATSDAVAVIQRGVKIAEAMKADKVVLVDLDSTVSGEVVQARVVDRRFAAGLRRVIFNVSELGEQEGVAWLGSELEKQLDLDVAADPVRHIDPLGIAKPILLTRHKRQIHKSPLFWAAVGMVAAGALGGGLAAAFSGGGGGDGLGTVRVNFESGGVR